MPSKNLTFYFRKLALFFRSSEESAPVQHRSYHEIEDGAEIFHTVGGRRRRGLIIDPGAANGLVGTETLRDLLANVDKAQQVKDTLEWKHQAFEVTGISGAADTTLGEIYKDVSSYDSWSRGVPLQGRCHRRQLQHVSSLGGQSVVGEHESSVGVQLVRE